MKIIVTANETFGPFATVETLDDRYRCNGELDLPFGVIGDDHQIIEADMPDGQADQFLWVNGAWQAKPKAALTDDEVAAIIQGYEKGVQKFMDAEASKRGYDDIARAVTYADEPAVPRFQQEGKAFRAWRSLIWQKCIEVQNEALAGSIAVPTVDQLIAMLPPLTGMPA